MKWWEVPTFRPVQPEWMTSTVVALLRNDMEYSSILADALDDAGCNDRKLLFLLREGNPNHKQLAFSHLANYPDHEPRFRLNVAQLQEFVEQLLDERLAKLPLIITERDYRICAVRYSYYIERTYGNLLHRDMSIDRREIEYADREEAAYLITEMCRRMYRELVIEIGVDTKFL